MARPDPTQRAPSKQPTVNATLSPRNRFTGWWPLLQQYGMLKTRNSRLIGNQGIAGVCQSTLLHQMTGLDYRVVTLDGEENDETGYYTLLLDNARDALGNVIGGSGLFGLMGQDLLNAHEGGNSEVVRQRGGRYDGVPVGLYAMDAATLHWTGGEEPIKQRDPNSQTVVASFTHDEVMHICWSNYAEAGRTWYNLHPVQKVWIAINCLAASDDYNYSLLTEVVPQGLLNLGTGFDKGKAMEWREAWRAAKQGGKLDDIGLLWGTDHAEFIRFQESIKDQPYQHMAYWYLTIVTGAHEMSPLDIGFMTQLNTKAGAEVSAELSKQKGLRHLIRAIKKAVEYWVLPVGLVLEWPDLDPSDERVEAETRRFNTEALSTAYESGWMGRDEARREANRLKVFQIEVEEETGEGEGPEASAGAEEEEEEGKALRPGPDQVMIAKSHAPRLVLMTCPLCGHNEGDQYTDHGGLVVCRGCGRTYDPELEL
jgi:hypothetical protein